MKYLIKCCGRIVDVDNKPIWCIKCGEHDIEVVEYTKDTMLSFLWWQTAGRGIRNYRALLV